MSNVRRRLACLALVLATTGILTRHALIGERFPARAQTAQSPVSTPDLVMPTLQAQVNAQATRIVNLEEQVDNQIRELRVETREKYLPLTVAATVLAILGIPFTVFSIWGVYKHARDKLGEQIDKAIYRVDPVNAIVHIPENDFDRERENLKCLGFYKFRPYRYLDNTCLEDCVVVVIKHKPEEGPEFGEFLKFLEKYSPDPKKVGYVIYTPHRLPLEQIRFPKVTCANMLPTLGTNLFTIARSLIR